MINVNCVIESADKKGYPQMDVNSVKDIYNAVEIILSDKKITVWADDIIQAVENCAHNGTRRRYIPVRRVDDEE